MVQLFTFPFQETLQQSAALAPDYMHPNHIPCAVIVEGLLTSSECEEIVTAANRSIPYKSPKCNAWTRELGHIPELDHLRDFAHLMNRAFWGYDLDEDSYTWLQTYLEGNDYQMHMDGVPGQMRKLTAVAFLSSSEAYSGGDLELFYHPISQLVPRTQGTVAIFQPWILHKVHPVVTGARQTLNMSFWGPNFK